MSSHHTSEIVSIHDAAHRANCSHCAGLLTFTKVLEYLAELGPPNILAQLPGGLTYTLVIVTKIGPHEFAIPQSALDLPNPDDAADEAWECLSNEAGPPTVEDRARFEVMLERMWLIKVAFAAGGAEAARAVEGNVSGMYAFGDEIVPVEFEVQLGGMR